MRKHGKEEQEGANKVPHIWKVAWDSYSSSLSQGVKILLTWGVVARLKALESRHGHFISL